MLQNRYGWLSLAAALALLVACGGAAPISRTPGVLPATATGAPAALSTTLPAAAPLHFDGERAYGQVLKQMAFGARPAGSKALDDTRAYILAQLEGEGWSTEVQSFAYKGVLVHNIVARKGLGQGPVVVLGAHYDTRRVADNDPQERTQPVPGANDGASGAAVLLELAHSLDVQYTKNEVWLAFFDAEDDGGLDGWDWLVGSRYMAEHLSATPAYVIVVDMVGDSDQQLYLERNSTPAVRDALWALAAQLGYSRYFIDQPKYQMIDDHTPFLQRGIAAVDVIDFDYPYWHTGADTADKVSAVSLEHVGRTLEAFLESSPPFIQQGTAYP